MEMVITSNPEASDSLLEDNTKPFKDFLESKKPELLYFKPDKRMWLEEIAKKLLVYEDPSTHFNMIQIGASSRALPDNPDTSVIATIIELLLIDEGYRDKIKDTDTFGLILMTFSRWIWEYLKKLEEEKAEKTVQIDSEKASKEDIYYTIMKTVMARHIIRTFVIENSDRQSVLGVFCFDGITYKPCDKDLEKEIEELTMENEDLSKKITRWVVKEALSKIKRRTYEPLRYEPLKIAFRNGLILNWETFLETGELRSSIEEPGPEQVVFHKIPHNLALDKLENLEGLAKFDEGLIVNLEELAEKLCPKTLNTFKEWVDDGWLLLFELIGFTLYPKYDMHKAVMLLGEGSNGKSSYLKLVRHILGKRNYVAIPLQELVEERFAPMNLYHKLANIFPDLPKKALKHTGKFKALTGEDEICADRKNRERICFVNYAKMLFSANELPSISDMTRAFWRRWIVIKWPHTFPQNPDFYDKTFTREELEGAIIVSLYAFRNAWKRRKFTGEGSIADPMREWLRNSNSVYAFIEDLMSEKGIVVQENERFVRYRGYKQPGAFTLTERLYELYIQYCEFEEIENRVSKRRFGDELEKLGFPRQRTHQGRGHKNITIKAEGLVDPSEL